MAAATIQTERELAVVLLNEDGSILDAQPSCASTLGWTREELIGKDVGELLSSGRDVLLAQLPQYDEGGDSSDNTSISVRVLARKKDKSEFAARVTIRRFPELGCWTLAVYFHPSDLESSSPPTVSAEEISLATRHNA